VLQAWDAAPSGQITIGGEVEGVLTAARRRRGVINLSLGSSQASPLEEAAMLVAFRAGSLVVAAAGNEFQQGNPLSYPASYNHVLTAAATGQDNRSSYFSSSSIAVDLAAPGQDIPVAVPHAAKADGYDVVDGTSFAAPIVSGAAAWVWTARPQLNNTQVFDLLRYSTTDVLPAGFDQDTGFGLLNIPNALAAEPPIRDPNEPNEDVYLVKPNGLFLGGTPLLARPRASLRGRLDLTEDPGDVHRAWLPGRSSLVATLRGSQNVDLEVWGPKTATVFERGAALRRDRLGSSSKQDTSADAVRVVNRSRTGKVVYVDAFLAKGVGDAAYALTVQTRALR
jgi:hypothetical protein